MKKELLLVSFLLAHVVAFSQGNVRKQLRIFSQDTAVRYASWSFCAMDIHSGKLLHSDNMHRSLIPASSVKVITTATALGILGSDFTYKTTLEYDGELKDGVLYGNLYIKGSGDPSLGSPYLEGVKKPEEIAAEFTEAVQRAGIKNIKGFVVGDDSVFDDRIPDSWQWNDLGTHYGSAAFGLNLHENVLFINYQQVKNVGEKPSVSLVSPHIPGLQLQTEVVSDVEDSGDNVYIFGAPYSLQRTLRGTIPVGEQLFVTKGAIPDPPMFAAYSFTQMLIHKGIAVEKGATDVRMMRIVSLPYDAPRTVIHTYSSPTLAELVKRTNEQSINLYAEAMLKTIGLKTSNQPTVEGGLKAVKSFWEAKGLTWRGNWLEDGSGLSPRNLVTTYTFAKLLQLIAQDKKIYGSFYRSLPVAGESGTLKNWFTRSSAKGVLRAKTGSMTRVMSYTGYTEVNGRKIAFSFVVNNYDCKNKTIRGLMTAVLSSLTD